MRISISMVVVGWLAVLPVGLEWTVAPAVGAIETEFITSRYQKEVGRNLTSREMKSTHARNLLSTY